MNERALGPLAELLDRVYAYLPRLAGAALLIVAGLALGWVAKRAVVRLLVWMRLDRLGGTTGWRAAFAKGDVRAALYNVAGNIASLIVFLIFLDNALQVLELVALSRMLERLVLYLPNLLLAGVILGAGGALARSLARRVQRALEEEEIARAGLAAKIVQAFIWAVVIAVALWQLNLAREIVLAAFLVAFGTLGIALALALGLGSVRAVERGWEALRKKKEE